MSLQQDTELAKAMLVAFDEAYELWRRKQADYGPNNIAQAGEVGVALRANDKVQRLLTLLGMGKGSTVKKYTAECESLRDSWLDLINYAAMGLLLRDNKWPQPELSDAPARCPHCRKEL